jgi:PAS domain S-box-containing protein
MANETANRAAESLLPASLLSPGTRESLLAASMPGLLIDAGNGAVLWSSHAAARRLGAADGADLAARGLPVFAPGTRRLTALAREIDAHAPRRLERLRFNSGFRSNLLTALCEPMMLASGQFALLVSLVDAAPARNEAFGPGDTPGSGELISASEAVALHRREDDEPALPFDAPAAVTEVAPSAPALMGEPEAIAATGEAPVETVSDPTSPLESAAAGTSAGDAPAWLAQPASERRVIRFVFGLDANGVVQRVTPPLAEAVGASRAEIAGQPLAAIVQDFDPGAAETIRSAVLSGETWSGISVNWPVADTGFSVPIELSALPQTDAEQGLIGYSGFGRCHLARAEARGPAMAATPAAILPDAPTELDADLAEAQGEAGPGDVAAPDLDTFATEAPTQDTPVQVSPPEGIAADDLATALDAFGAPDDAAEDAAALIDGKADVETPDAETTTDAAPEPPSAEAPLPPEAPANVVSLRNDQPEIPTSNRNGLSMSERNAFREIARALGAKFDEADVPGGQVEPPSHSAARADAAAPDAGQPAEPPREAARTVAPPAPALGGELLDHLPVGLLVLTGDVARYANRTLLDLTGYPDFSTFLAERGAEAIFRKGTMPRDREAGFDTITLSTREGELIPVDAHLQMTDWQGGKATLVSFRRAIELEQGKALRSVALDLKRVRAEAQELRAVLDTATDGVATLDEKGRILSVNGAAEALFGLDQREVVGESFTMLLHNESHADALDYFEGLRANGVRSVLNDGRDVFGREKKGGRIPLFMTLGRISDDEPRRYCAVLRDLTSWKRAETELTDARRSAELASAKKSDFLTKISHEIRTPMNAIIGFAEVMIEERLGPVPNPKYKEYLGDIRTSGKHVVSLVNDLLDLSKIEAGRMEMSFAATDLNAIVASSVGIIQPQANQNRVLVRTQLANRLPSVVADERSIRQIILNVLSNATRFTESGGQVIVATALLDSGEAVIRIRDTGVGMSASEIEQALEPFRQVGTRRNQGGTGLGLPLTKALVEANRANFAIRSTPGEGTMVEVTFPSTRVLAE